MKKGFFEIIAQDHTFFQKYGWVGQNVGLYRAGRGYYLVIDLYSGMYVKHVQGNEKKALEIARKIDALEFSIEIKANVTQGIRDKNGNWKLTTKADEESREYLRAILAVR